MSKELERKLAELSRLARSREELSVRMEAEVHRLREELDLRELVAIGIKKKEVKEKLGTSMNAS